MSSFHSLNRLLRDRLCFRKQRVDTFLWLLTAIIDQGTVRLWRLASVVSSQALPQSTLRRFERFFATQSIDRNWRARLCWALAGCPKRCDLILDRTQWFIGTKPVNILVLAVSVRRYTIPLLWCFFPHRGVCSATDCAKLLDQFIKLFGKECINELLADREFGNAPMVKLLTDRDIDFTIRVKSGLQVIDDAGRALSLSSLCRKQATSVRGQRYFRFTYQDAGRFHVACSFKKQAARRNKKTGELKEKPEDQMILITTLAPTGAVKRYRKRWKIEVMFADMKSRGFNLEETRMTAENKLDVLLSLVAIAYVWVCTTVGNTHLKINNKKHGYKACSWFRVALTKARKRMRNEPQTMLEILWQNTLKTERVG